MSNLPTPMMINVNSFLADTIHLSTKEIGAYVLLLAKAWEREDHPVPTDEELKPHPIEKHACRRHIQYEAHPSNWPEGKWSVVRAAVLLRDGSVCAYCKGTDGPFEVDHVFPKSRGGPNTAANLVAACKPCNRSKGALTPDEWMSRR